MRIIVSLFTLLLLTSCSTTRVNRSEVLKREASIAQLEKYIENARFHTIDILAPSHFEKAEELFKKALGEAEHVSNVEKSNAFADAGLKEIHRAEKVADKTRTSLHEALEKRRQAMEVHAHLLFQSEFEGLDTKLKRICRAIEEGNEEAGVRENAAFASSYSALELKSLKADISENASKAYNEAEKLDAHRLAPETMQKAKSELIIAKKILELEKGDYEKARTHAEQALYLAHRARYIAELITGFQKQRLSHEKILLWYQDQLELVNQGLDRPLAFDQPNRQVVSSLNETIHRKIIGSHQMADEQAQKLSEKERHLQKLKNKLDTPGELDTFNKVSALFDPDEAEVLKRGNDIIIRSHGFKFDIGKAELLPSNFSLLNKIVKALAIFPKANVMVEGHTDNTGSDALNMRLSHERAHNVKDFLIKVAERKRSTVQSIGYGKEKPLKSNATKEGRAQNRRIEIIITP